MNSLAKTQSSYKNEIAFLSIMTLVFGFLCLLFGYIMLPLAAGFYAALLAIEKKGTRFFSYVVPLLPLVVNVFINGFYSLEAISYVVIGFIIFLGYDRNKNKALTVFFATCALVLLIIASFILYALDNVGVFKFSAIGEFVFNLYDTGKMKFIEFVTSFKTAEESGLILQNFNAGEAVDMYNSIILSIVPLGIVFAFVLVGISTKLLTYRIKKIDFQDEKIISWKFITSPFLAYSYIVIAIFASLSRSGILGISLSTVATVFMVIYFYIGFTSLFNFVSAKKGRRFAITATILTFLIFYSFAPQIISYIGVFVNNAAYHSKNSDDLNV